MKKLFTSMLACALLLNVASAQYYYIPHLTAYQNPGGLNTDTEYPVGGGQVAGWTSIHPGSASTPAWSQQSTIPFAFSLNGTTVADYKVSTSGVLTFTTTATTVPPTSNVALPAANIPDNSICVWGIAGNGANDNICTKDFGTAPNQQHWVIFSSYTDPASGSWTYWAIVFEETTNKIYIVDQRQSGSTNVSLTLGIQINNTTAYMVAGSPNVTHLAQSDATPADNVYYEFIQGVQVGYDVQTLSITTPSYLLVSTPTNIEGDLVNFGTATITSLDLNYQVDNGPIVTAPVSGLSVATNATYTYSHPTPWTPAASGIYTVKSWASNINGNADLNNANDTVTKGFGVASALTQRIVLIEEFTNASCPPCAAQNPAFQAICDANAGKLALVKYHTVWPGVDPMNAFNPTEVADRVNYYNVSGVPNADMDGFDVPGSSYLGAPANVNQANIDAAYNKPALFDMTLAGSLNLISGQLDITGTATSHINFPSGNVFIRVALIEDPVAYTNPPGTNGEDVFPETMRKMFPDAGGTPIATPVDGQVDNINFTYIIDPIFVASNLNLVAWVQDDLTSEVHQSIMVPVVISTSIDDLNGVNAFVVFPNPARDYSNLVFDLKNPATVTIEVFNSIGAKVLSDNKGRLDAGKQIFNINTSSLSNGLYSVKVTVNGNSNVRKILIEK